MGAVLTKASAVNCANEGIVETVGSAKLTVSGAQVLLESGIVGQSISGCTTADNPPSDVPCTKVLNVNPSSLAIKLLVGGNPVVLASLTGNTNGSVPNLLPATGTQTLLTTT
jgi:hypothetical protein